LEDYDIVKVTGNLACETMSEFLPFSMFNWCRRYTSVGVGTALHMMCYSVAGAELECWFCLCDTGYLEQGFLALQQAIDSAIIQFMSGSAALNITEVMIRLRRFPYPPYVHDNFVLVIQQQFPFIVLLSFIFFAMQIVRDLVYEKERCLKVLIFS